jgi:Mn2+/Fe2+ NRAMP family transporter
MAAATRLIVPLPHVSLVVAFAVMMAIIEIILPYHQYSRILKWLCISLLSYIAVLFIVNVSWFDVASEIVSPSLSFNKNTIAALIALFGTTISPYLFFWQTSEEVEELNIEGERTAADGDAVGHLRAMRGDVVAGMSSGVLVMFAIMVTSAATLGVAGISTVFTAEQAAMALEPLAGSAAKYLFALGIVGTGLLAIPVLAGSTSYALAETFGWREGLSLKLSQARAFYMVIVVSMCLGMAMNLVGLDPVRALYWSAILNGVAAPPLIVMIWILSRRQSVLGERRSGRLSSTFVGLAALVSTALPIVYLAL